jgi:hypothetical protein
VTPGLHATLYRHGEGNLLVLQGDGRTLLHANSAAQTGSRKQLLSTAALLKQQHGNVDLLFASRHNHSWVPHCVSFRDTTRVVPRQWHKSAESRFLELVRCLDPRMAFPLEDPPHNLLGNTLRVNGSPEPDLEHAEERAERVQMHFKPGDCVLDDQFVPVSHSRHRDAPVLKRQHRVPLLMEEVEGTLDPARLNRLRHRILRNLRERAPRLLQVDQDVQCRIDLEDHPGISFFVCASRLQVSVEMCDALRLSPVAVRLRLEVLESWLSTATGYRSLTTAMGACWMLDRERLPEASLLVDLLGRRTLPPSWTERLSLWVLHPQRAFDIWRQRRRHRCGTEQEAWDRLDPYTLLQAPEEDGQDHPDVRIA